MFKLIGMVTVLAGALMVGSCLERGWGGAAAGEFVGCGPASAMTKRLNDQGEFGVVAWLVRMDDGSSKVNMLFANDAKDTWTFAVMHGGDGTMCTVNSGKGIEVFGIGGDHE